MSSRVTRRLAAIMVVDMVGYSRLVEADETGALAEVRQLRQNVLDPLLKEHGGRLVKLLGDGLIAEFGSVVGAVACALAVQEQMCARNAEKRRRLRLELRIGVNLGDVVVEGEDLLGDGINVAARLEQICQPGAVTISGAVYDQLSGKLEVRFAELGEQRLKNIARPVRVYRVLAAGADPTGITTAPNSEKPAVAVLPFDDPSGHTEQSYFSDGITEDVITELSRFREFLVIARTSSFSFRDKGMDIRDIARALGATYVVQGSVRRAADRVRITAQLVDAESRTHLWAERYDRAIEDVFAVQEEIAQSIVATVAQRMVDAGEIEARRRLPRDIRAYDLFLRALKLGGTSFTSDALAQIESLYEQVLALDPTFARAYSGLAFIYRDRSMDRIAGVTSVQDQGLLLALHMAERALALDPNDPRIHYTLGMMSGAMRDFERAERHFALARAMNPNDAVIQLFWGWIQGVRGRPECGLPAVAMACRLNPCHPPWYGWFIARLQFALGHYAEAAALLERRMWDVPARQLRNLAWRAAALGHLGRLEQAALCAEELLREIAAHWQGDPSADSTDYLEWVVWSSLFEHPGDEDRLREGLRLAGLSARGLTD